VSSEKLEERVSQIQARLTEIGKERVELERAPDRAERQLAEARAEVEDLTVRIKNGATGDHGADLAAALREVARLEETVAELERSTAPKLDKLSAEEQKLRDDITRTNREIAKLKLSEAVMAYQAILRQALPHVEVIRTHAAAAGVILPYQHEQSILIERGTHVCGGIVIELR